MLPGTAQIWIESLMAGRTWEQGRDTPRIRSTFLTLATTCDRWPGPKQFLDAVPRVEQAALGYEVKPASREEAEAAMARIRAMLADSGADPMPTFKPEPVSREQREEAERELAAMRDRKTQAAGADL